MTWWNCLAIIWQTTVRRVRDWTKEKLELCWRCILPENVLASQENPVNGWRHCHQWCTEKVWGTPSGLKFHTGCPDLVCKIHPSHRYCIHLNWNKRTHLNLKKMSRVQFDKGRWKNNWVKIYMGIVSHCIKFDLCIAWNLIAFDVSMAYIPNVRVHRLDFHREFFRESSGGGSRAPLSNSG